MKAFLRHILIFSLCILVPLIAAEIYVESLPNPSKTKHSWMSAHSESVSTLILGSSHTFYGVTPSLFPDTAFSLSQVSQTYRYDSYLLRHYPMPKLRTVILPFSYFSLYEDFESQPHEQFNAKRYRIYMDCDLHFRLGWYGFEFTSIDPFVEKLKSLYKPQHMTWDSLGFGTDYTFSSRPADWDNGEAAASGNTYTDTTLVDLNMGFLDDIMTFCQERHARLLLITTPLSPGFRNHQQTEQTERNARCLKQILCRHPEVVYLDFSADPTFTDSLFYDSHHLNGRGAGFLTRKLIENIQQLKE